MAELENRPGLAKVATELAEWLLKNQLASGGIPGGVGAEGAPIAFDTGQALFGLLDRVERLVAPNSCRGHAERVIFSWTA